MKPAWRVAFWVLLAIVIAQGIGIYLGRRALWEANVAAANARAQRDRTRTRYAGELAIAERLAMQLRVELDSVMRRKGQTDHALVRIRIERDSLAARVPVAVMMPVPDTIQLRATFDARDSLGVYVQTLTTIGGVAVVAPNPAAWSRFNVVREPMQLDVGLSCNGHDALAQVSGPRWATIDLREVRQDPEICNPRPRWEPFSFEAPSLPWAAGLVGIGVLLRSLLP